MRDSEEEDDEPKFSLVLMDEDVEERRRNRTPTTKKSKKEVKEEKIECLICLARIEPNEKVWNCKQCFTMLHLVCARQWGENSPKNKLLSEGFDLYKDLWNCPNCRIQIKGIPKGYHCFCGKRKNPGFNFFLFQIKIFDCIFQNRI